MQGAILESAPSIADQKASNARTGLRRRVRTGSVTTEKLRRVGAAEATATRQASKRTRFVIEDSERAVDLANRIVEVQRGRFQSPGDSVAPQT